MASVYKCDRCGKYYDKSTASVGPIFKKHKDCGVSDLCRECKTSLTKWFNDCKHEHPEHVEEFIKLNSIVFTHDDPGVIKYITVKRFIDALEEYFDYKWNEDDFRMPTGSPSETKLEGFIYARMKIDNLYGPVLTIRDCIITVEWAKVALKRYFNYEWKDEFDE